MNNDDFKEQKQNVERWLQNRPMTPKEKVCIGISSSALLGSSLTLTFTILSAIFSSNTAQTLTLAGISVVALTTGILTAAYFNRISNLNDEAVRQAAREKLLKQLEQDNGPQDLDL